jgi:putative hydrolase of the HAD superfamily
MLITKGDGFEQGLKITRSGMDRYFEIVEIVGDKSEASYRAILARYGIDPERFLMVGNSMRSDIVPVLRLGGKAVYIPQANTWYHENITGDAVDEGDFHELEHFWQLPEMLRGLESDP